METAETENVYLVFTNEFNLALPDVKPNMKEEKCNGDTFPPHKAMHLLVGNRVREKQNETAHNCRKGKKGRLIMNETDYEFYVIFLLIFFRKKIEK